MSHDSYERGIEEFERHSRRIEASRGDLIARRDQLLIDIQRAFAGVSRGPGVTLREARVLDDRGTGEERARARAEDQDADWSEVDAVGIDLAGVCLLFLDPIAFRYYLPAYLCAKLRLGYEDLSKTPDSDANALAFLSCKLDPEESGNVEWFKALSDDNVVS